jgi:hypothetical protein
VYVPVALVARLTSPAVPLKFNPAVDEYVPPAEPASVTGAIPVAQ